MDKLSAPQFVASLNALAEVFDKKAVSPKALELWFDTLREFDSNRVLSSLNGWAKTHIKFPAPAEVWKALNEEATVRRERVAVAEKKVFERQAEAVVDRRHGEQRMRDIMAILSKSKPTPRQHWTDVQNTTGLPAISYRYAERFFGRNKPEPVIERQAGQDDEEAVASEAPI